jgi:hypothetical protein
MVKQGDWETPGSERDTRWDGMESDYRNPEINHASATLWETRISEGGWTRRGFGIRCALIKLLCFF